MHILYSPVDLSAGIDWAEGVQGEATAALTGKMQLIRSNARMCCKARDIIQLMHIARMPIGDPNLPFIGPTQVWMREDISLITADGQPISNAKAVTIEVGPSPPQ